MRENRRRSGGGNVRRTPRRRREACPVCGRDVAYTLPFGDEHADNVMAGFKAYTAHHNPEGAPCPAPSL